MTGFEQIKMTQTWGETLIFEGRLLAENNAPKKVEPDFQRTQLWETRGGNWIAVYQDRKGQNSITVARVIAPNEDEYARRLAVMDALEWRILARTMTYQQLGWRFEREVA